MQRKRPPASEHMISRARQLRQRAFFPERLVWGRLRNGRCAGLKFHRQHPIGPYIVDYFCASAKVAIELDGRSHDDQQAEDVRRQDFLERQGMKVLRFTNDEVLTNIQGVLEAIADACLPPEGGRNSSPPSP